MWSDDLVWCEMAMIRYVQLTRALIYVPISEMPITFYVINYIEYKLRYIEERDLEGKSCSYVM